MSAIKNTALQFQTPLILCIIHCPIHNQYGHNKQNKSTCYLYETISIQFNVFTLTFAMIIYQKAIL